MTKNARIIVRKSERILELYCPNGHVRVFPIVIGFSPEGDKEFEGDGRTPVGDFYVFTKNDQSKFHRSLGLSYPRVADAKRGLENGVISRADHDDIVAAHKERRKPPQYTPLGGEIYIHGGGTDRDSTRGCIGLEDLDIEEIFEAVEVGATVTILP
jgi:murein L,D-transpeptidase YafK